MAGSAGAVLRGECRMSANILLAWQLIECSDGKVVLPWRLAGHAAKDVIARGFPVKEFPSGIPGGFSCQFPEFDWEDLDGVMEQYWGCSLGYADFPKPGFRARTIYTPILVGC